MIQKLAFGAMAWLLAAAPVWAGSFRVYEGWRGGPGVTGNFPAGSAQLAQIRFDADTAEGGGLALGATEFDIRPTGSVVLRGFRCELAACSEGNDYVFTPGNAAAGGRILVSDPDFNYRDGIHDLGEIKFEGASEPGGIDLVRCNYTGQDYVERSCDRFALVAVPEPGFGWLFAPGAALLFGPLRGRRLRSRSGQHPPLA